MPDRTRRLALSAMLFLTAAWASPGSVSAVTSTLVGTQAYTSSNSNLAGLTIRWSLYRRTGTGKCADYELRGTIAWSGPPPTGWWQTAGDTVPDPDTFELDMQLPTGYVLQSTAASASWRDLQKGTTTTFTPTLMEDNRDIAAWKFKEMQGHGERTLGGWKHYKRYTSGATFRAYFYKTLSCASSPIHDLVVKAKYIRTVDDGFKDWSYGIGFGAGGFGLAVSVTPTTDTASINPTSWGSFLVP